MDHDGHRIGPGAEPTTGSSTARRAGAPSVGAVSMRVVPGGQILATPPVAGIEEAPTAIDLVETARVIGETATVQDATFTGAENGLDAQELSRVLSGIDRLTSALAALEMRTMTALDERIRAEDAEARVPLKEQGRRTAGEIRMASRISPATASRRLRSGERLVREMPRVFGALADGRLAVDAAYAIGRGSGPVSPELRPAVDEVIETHLPDLEGISTGRWSQEISAIAQCLEPEGAPDRHREAVRERSVSVTPGAHGMGTVSAHLSGLDAAAIRRKLSLQAESLRAQGDRRTHAQIMADLFADTLLGRDETMDPVHLDIGVVVSERSLLAPEHGEPAHLEGYGVIEASQIRDRVQSPRPERRPTGSEAPLGARGRAGNGEVDTDAVDETAEQRELRLAAQVARELAGHSAGAAHSEQERPRPRLVAPPQGADPTSDPQLPPPTSTAPPTPPAPADPPASPDLPDPVATETIHHLRRLYTHPTAGELVAVESRSRAFPPGLARLIRLRDQRCAAPYCDAPIRHLDHIRPVSEGGATSAENGQGLCAHCNLTKEVLGRVEHTPTADGRHAVTWTTRLGRTATVSPRSLTGLPLTGSRTQRQDQEREEQEAVLASAAARSERDDGVPSLPDELQCTVPTADPATILRRLEELQRESSAEPGGAEREERVGYGLEPEPEPTIAESEAMYRAAVASWPPAGALEDEDEILAHLAQMVA
ncbi:hypothetical protein DEO23_06360 [Brachybacterium endophyticum]|uniref:HNH nuclease domain-containing protein n=1 Tax=Brachybacterium endophyticum TaxID=2182385 RepID=A0A2U2RL31_9MICO|nr:HNH endonuclease signature motif containing protein [Brachybacterium endophyticum]PWH06573.1 hypothetical protein DEO23_06360 [Brachybacterium endophyticum]